MALTAHSTRNASPADHAGTPARRWDSGFEPRWWTLIAVSGTFMPLVDITIVQVALPTIERHLGASLTDLK